FGVDRVVIPPVGNGAARDPHDEAGAVGHRVAGDVAAVTPAVESDPRAIDVGLLFQPRHAVLDVPQFALAEVPVHGPDRLAPFAAGRSVVANPDDDALLREELVIHVL